jgi:phosphotransferase system enzyme I (PtsI)
MANETSGTQGVARDDAERAGVDAPSAAPPTSSTGASAPADVESAPARAAGPILRGATVAPGLVLGRVHRQDHDLARERAERVPLDEIEVELNRFRQALDDARLQLTDLRSRLAGRVREEDAHILDTHLAYLRDSAFIADVENLILNEQMRLEGAIGKVVGDFDRIFRLVQNETLRQSAVDLRDVGIRVLRNLERRSSDAPAAPPPRDYILVGRELSIVDMFNLANENVKGIVTQAGGLTSHAAIFARSMRIPTLTGV